MKADVGIDGDKWGQTRISPSGACRPIFPSRLAGFLVIFPKTARDALPAGEALYKRHPAVEYNGSNRERLDEESRNFALADLGFRVHAPFS